MSGTTSNIKDRPRRPDNRCELFEQFAIERIEVELVDELPRIGLASDVVRSAD
jgi:hypothetical protein